MNKNAATRNGGGGPTVDLVAEIRSELNRINQR